MGGGPACAGMAVWDAGQRIVPNAFERVKILRDNINYRELCTQIEVDGNIDVKNAALLANFGARIFVLGTSSIFNGAAGDLGETRQASDALVALKRKTV